MITYTLEDLYDIGDGNKIDELMRIVESLPKCTGSCYYIAGGAIRRSIIGDDLQKGDIDLFFKSKAQYDEWLFRKGNHIQIVKSLDHADNYIMTLPVDGKKYDIQVVKIAFYNNVEELLDSFDYTITQFAIPVKDMVSTTLAWSKLPVHAGVRSMWDLARKRLVINKITYPLASLRRLIKYTNQGYYACNGALQTYMEELRNIPDADFKNRQITYID